MEMENTFRMRMLTAALPTAQPWHPGPHDSSMNGADRARHGSHHPEAMPAHPGAIKESAIVPIGSAYLVEIFGLSAGVLVRDGTRLVFRAAHRAFRELDESRFGSAAHAERAVYSSWTRFQHRSRPGMRSGGRSR